VLFHQWNSKDLYSADASITRDLLKSKSDKPWARKRVLVVHPQLSRLGGAEIVALSIIQWLMRKGKIEIVLLLLEPLDFSRISGETGFSFGEVRPKVLIAPCPSILLRSKLFFLLRIAFLHKFAKSIAGDFDFWLSTYNELDFGQDGFQYIHHPQFATRRTLGKYQMAGRRSLLDKSPLLDALYRLVVFSISGGTNEGFKRNITATNSQFTKGVIHEAYGIDSVVIYPASNCSIQGKPQVSWSNRKFQFVAVGRISYDKQQLLLVDLFEKVFSAFPSAKLVIVGQIGDEQYFELLKREIAELKIPVELVLNATKSELLDVLEASQYFLHAKQFEHFGIAIAEAIASGCVPLIHDSGGQREIVTDDRLRYRSAGDIMSIVGRMQTDESVRNSVLKFVSDRRNELSLDSFYRKMDRVLWPAPIG
jgi:glycosyltransferase involved in cell wall biosynthesis